MKKSQSITSRIVNVYKAASIVFLNTVVLFVCLELAAGLATKISHPPGEAAEDEEDKPRATTSYYASQDWSKQYWKEHERSLAQRYHPYVVWRRAPFQGKLINVDQHGIRSTPGAECGANSYKVFAFGGSTMWGTGAPDWGTIPAYLQSGFAALQRGPVCVVNFGESAFVSTQSVIQLLIELQSGNVPDLVIFYDGVNDVYAAYQSGRPTHQNLSRIVARLERDKNPVSFAKWAENSYSFMWFKGWMSRLKPKSRNKRTRANYKTLGVDTAALSESVVKVYLGNRKIVNALAQRYGFQFFFFWQPVISIGEKSLTTEEQEMRLGMNPDLVELYESVYRDIRQAASKDDKLYYLAEIFNGYNSQVWIDHHHVTPVGNQRIARRMLDIAARDRERGVAKGR